MSNLVKTYGMVPAVRGVSFEVDKGHVVGFLGPNGAGKSTTLRVLAGFLSKTSGTVRVCGHDVDEDPELARTMLGYMPEAVPLYTEMRVVEYLAFRAELKRVPRNHRRSYVDDAMEKANVTEVANRTIGQLSKGYRQRVGLADALVAKPPLLVLDEPTSGLDPNQIRDVRAVLAALGKEHTVLLSTHILSEVEATCDRVVVIDRGKVVAEGTQADLAKKRRLCSTRFVVRAPLDRAGAIMENVAGVVRVAQLAEESFVPESADATAIECVWNEGATSEEIADATEAVVRALVERGVGVRHVSPVGTSLEELFQSLTRPKDIEPEAAS